MSGQANGGQQDIPASSLATLARSFLARRDALQTDPYVEPARALLLAHGGRLHTTPTGNTHVLAVVNDIPWVQTGVSLEELAADGIPLGDTTVGDQVLELIKASSDLSATSAASERTLLTEIERSLPVAAKMLSQD